MNIHHLELFYYVARHKGIAGAVRNMPYGIQQPAVSAQVIQLENDLGVTLFQRRPFELTPAGEAAYRDLRTEAEDYDARLRGQFTSGEVATASPIRRAARALAAPPTRTVTNFDAPSPSRTT